MKALTVVAPEGGRSWVGGVGVWGGKGVRATSRLHDSKIDEFHHEENPVDWYFKNAHH